MRLSYSKPLGPNRSQVSNDIWLGRSGNGLRDTAKRGASRRTSPSCRSYRANRDRQPCAAPVTRVTGKKVQIEVTLISERSSAVTLGSRAAADTTAIRKPLEGLRSPP